MTRSYKEPQNEDFKVSPYWIDAIANALSEEHSITIKRGTEWSIDMKKKVIVYTDDLSYLDKDSVLALLLHETGHMKYSDIPWFDEHTSVYKSAPEVSRLCINAFEDTRIDNIVSIEYENSESFINRLHEQSSQKAIETLSQYDAKMKNLEDDRKHFLAKLNNAKIQLTHGKVTVQEFIKWENENNPEKQNKEINPIAEIIFLFMIMYYDDKKNHTKLLSDYYNPEFVKRAEKILKMQNTYFPENMMSTREVQKYYEEKIFPIIEDLIERNPDGSEKKFDQNQNNSSDGSSQNQNNSNEEKFNQNDKFSQELKEKVQKLKEKNSKSIGVGTEPPIPCSEINYEEYLEKVKQIVSTSTTRFNRILKDNKFDRYAGKFSTGQLNMKRLFKYKTNDFKLFQKKTERKNKDYAFSIMLDCSGSMSGKNIQESMKGLVLMSEVLNKLKIPFHVTFFSSGKPTFGKTFDRQFSRKTMSNEANRVWNGGTEILKAFVPTLDALKERKERKKIMIVLTDGEIYSDEKQSIIQLIKDNKDITYYGIGIDVKLDDIFKNNIEIEDVNELMPKFANILKKHIKIG